MTRSAIRSGVVLLAALLTASLPAAAADSFYEDLLRSGKGALLDGRLDEAALELEIACFGFLDEPALLGEGLSHLALAQSRRGEAQALSAVIERLISLEEAHGGYSKANLDAATRSDVERLLGEQVPLDRLAALDAFQSLAERKDLEALMATDPETRRRTLEQRLIENPEDVQSLQLLADLELSAGNAAAALPRLDALVALSGGDTGSICRRFEAATQAGACDLVSQDLDSCPNDATTPEAAPQVLSCLIERSETERANLWVASLDPALRSTGKVRKLERQLERQITQQARAAERLAEADEQAPESVDPVVESPESEQIAEAATPTPQVTPAPRTMTAPQIEPMAEAETVDACAGLREAAKRNLCDELAPDNPECSDTLAEPKVARAVTECLVRAERWSDALGFLDGLPIQVSGLPKLRKLERQATRGLEKSVAESEASAAAEAPPSEATLSAAGPTLSSSPAAVEPEAEETAPISDPEPTAATAAPADELRSLRRQLNKANTTQELGTAYGAAVRFAREYPESSEAQFLAAEAAYRASQWDQAIRLFDAGGDPDATQPLLLFYKAVALFESGDAATARTYLERALPHLQKTAFVRAYEERIQAAARGAG